MIKYSGIYESSTPPPSTKALWVDGGVLKIYKNGSWRPVDDPKSKLTIDSILKAGSTNPVENKAIYSRFLGVDKDIEVNKNNINVLTGRVNEVDGVAKGAEALAKVNEERINSVTGTANAAKELAQKNEFNLRQVQATANTALTNSNENRKLVTNAQTTANEAKALVNGLTGLTGPIKIIERDVSQLKELNVVYPSNLRNLTVDSTPDEVKEAFIPSIGGTPGTTNTPHVGYLIKGNRNSDNQDDPDSTIISVEIVKIDDKDCHKFMYIDNNRDLVTMTVDVWGYKVIERSVVSNIDTIIDKTAYTFDGRLCVLEKGDNISEFLIPENMLQSVTPRVGDNIRLNRYYDTPSENPSWAIIIGVQQSGNRIMVSASSIDTTFRFSYNATTYEVIIPWTEMPSSKKIYDGTLLLDLGDTTDEAKIKKAFTPKGYAQPVIPDNGDIVQSPEESFIVFNIVQEDEFVIYVYGPQNANLIIALQCRKDFTTSLTLRGVIRMARYYYDGNALLSTEITTPSDIKLLYTPMDDTYGYKSISGAEPPKVGDIIFMPTTTSESFSKGVVVDTAETNNTYITRWFYGGKLYEAEVTKDFTSIPKYGKVIYDTNSGTLRDLYISAGAKYNEATGYYELNGLTDITEKEMRNIYLLYITNSSNAQHLVSWLGDSLGVRTNIAPYMYYAINMQNSIGANVNLEVLALSKSSLYISGLVAVAHGSFPKLKKVLGTWVYNSENPSDFNFSYGQPFGNCPLLEEIQMKGINKSHTFAVSPNLSKESVLYMITNANPPSGAAVGSITITLHPTVYTRLKDDADIVAALEAKGGIITLVSA